MKKLLSLFTAITLMAGCFTACSTNAVPAADENKNLQIVTTIFPEYDWVMNILGENPAGAEVTMLLDNGTDLHSFQPTVEDILKISTCDVFVYVGGESDEWVDDVLKEATNKDMIVISLMDELGKTVKMKGQFVFCHDEEKDQYYYACLIRDAMACCSQGLEFIPAGDCVYPDDFPPALTEIVVTGVFNVLEDNGETYCALTDADYYY